MYDFKTLIAEELQQLEKMLSTYFYHKHIPWIQSIAEHALLEKGKRLRASLVLLLSGAVTLKEPSLEALTLAAVIEMLHAAMLLHDDVVDGAFLRRMQPCAHLIWGPTASILMGDYIYAQAFLLIQTLQTSNITMSLASATSNVIVGELKQQSLLHNPKTSMEEYYFVIDHKTGELFATALSNTIRLTGETQTAWAERWGKAFGRLYQITDDLIDIQASCANTDKSLSQDIKQGLVTLPTLLLFEKMTSTDKAYLSEMIQHSEKFNESIYQSWISQYHIENDLYKKIQDLSNHLTLSLQQELADSHYRTSLINLVNYISTRTH